jgi:hypothetical protein
MSRRRSEQCKQGIESKPRNDMSFGVSSSAVPQLESSSTGPATEPRSFSAIKSQYIAIYRPVAGPINTCQRLRRPTPAAFETERDCLYANRARGIDTLLISGTQHCKSTNSLAYCRPENHWRRTGHPSRYDKAQGNSCQSSRQGIISKLGVSCDLISVNMASARPLEELEDWHVTDDG